MWTENVSLLPYNTFGIQARCKRFAAYHTVAELQDILQALRTTHPNDPILCVGEGSNLLFTTDFPGTVLHSEMKGLAVTDFDEERLLVSAESGWNWDEFVGLCTEKGYYGLENLSYIPGTVGASAVQNIGAYGVEAEQLIHQVHAVEIATGECRTFAHDMLRYGYRQSIFKQEWKGRFVITRVDYLLHKSFQPATAYGSLGKIIAEQHNGETLTAQKLRDIIIHIRREKLPEPAELGSAGSFFMNPVINAEAFAALQRLYPTIPHYVVEGGIKVPAGWLIEQCGWKGKRQGAAGVYDKQALVIVNHGGATGEEIAQLSERICKDVYNKFGIAIHPEVNFI
ncbi:MAG: UDP-N-acetylmuramate dehydrogenase [Bacteroidaceae bacterium]|nr:UDP-N-acetylmuramate dehydrogenase [Bacteroidaceae bacterium]